MPKTVGKIRISKRVDNGDMYSYRIHFVVYDVDSNTLEDITDELQRLYNYPEYLMETCDATGKWQLESS